MSLLRLPAGFFGPAASGVGVVEINFTLGDVRFDVVELGVQDADLTEVTAFERLELGAELGEAPISRSASRVRTAASCSAPVFEEGEIVRGLLEDDFGWHAASRGGKF